MTLAEVCVRRPVFTTMLIMFLVVLGVFSFLDLGVDLFPKADPPIVSVRVRLPGASPDEMTSQVILPVEEQLSSVSGLDELEIMVMDGSARITCRFVLDRKMEDAAQDVREKMALAMGKLPPNVEPPVITKADPESDPILTLVVGGPRSLREITEITDKQIKRALQTVDGVAAIDIVGGRDREIQILLDAEKLNSHRIAVNQVARALENENIEAPGGRLFQGTEELAVRTMGRFDVAREFSDLIVSSAAGAPIKVSDLGRVEDTYKEPRSFARLDGKPAVTMQIRRQAGTNTVKVVDAVRDKLEKLRPTVPDDLTIDVVSDQSLFIRASIASLEEHLLLGSLLASLVILLFIRNWRAVLISSLAIPASIIATFTLMRIAGFTLNNMTLLALTLSVGIVIDDAIVVLENIFRHLEEFRRSPMQAAIEGTKEVALAVTATTLSLVVIFVPIAFMTGYAQRYLNSFGWTMTCAILVSLLVSFTLTPMLGARFLRRGPDDVKLSKQTAFFTWIERRYERMLNWSLNHPWVIVGLSVLVFASTFPLNRMVGRDFIPNDDQGEFTIHVDLPEGLSLTGLTKFVDEIEPKLQKLPELDHLLTQSSDRLNHVHFVPNLVELDKRKISTQEAAAAARKIFEQVPQARQKIAFPSALGGGESLGFPIQVQLLGPELDKLGELARKAGDEIRALPGIVSSEPSFFFANPELRVTIDRARAAELGVRAADVAGAVRLMMSGEDEISNYREAGEQYPVKIMLDEKQRGDREILSRLMVPSSKLEQVRIDNIAGVNRGLGPSRLSRFNRQYNVPIYAANAPDKPLSEAVKDITQVMQNLNLPPGYRFFFGGNVKALDETTNNLIMAFLLAIVFMYMVLAAQFESFTHPFIILLALPLSVPFALLSLYLTGRTLNLWSTLGVLLLLGIVKKNAILQVDYTNHLRAQGVPLREAILQADRARLRPILMTTFAIIAGLIPTAFGRGAGSAQRSAIAVTIIGGQLFCLLLTLLLTPVAYELLDRWSPKALRVRQWSWKALFKGASEKPNE
ncbi:MAG TPA: efflux RND transporter permease subunit [Blastocatellia bacterium]|nr:efflux RND transporter permease subunit [Blastocatellia bacterium]